jgi:cholesterol transport system auxiliary component
MIKSNFKKYFTSIIACAGVLGCTQAPVLKVYSLDVPKIKQLRHSAYKNKIIKVTFPQSLREQMSEKMNFSYSDNDYGTYLNSLWSNNMSKLLQGTLIEVLEESDLFSVVLSDSSTLKENYRLESNIFSFEHKVRSTYSVSLISIQFTVIDADSGKWVKSRRFSYEQPTQTIDAEGYAAATNIAIKKLSEDLLTWLR